MSPETLRALIFDVDGTLADTESVHRAAFNEAFAAAGLDWYWDEELYTRLLEVSGGKERMTRYWQEMRQDLPQPSPEAVAATVERLHEIKTAVYSRLVEDGALKLRPGVGPLIESARAAGLRLAIATTTSPANIAVLLRAALGSRWRDCFEVIEDAATAPRKKPHPQVYLQALQRLELGAAACLALEDSANGLQAAIAAHLPVIVTPSPFTEHHDFSGALRVLPSLAGVSVADLCAWHHSGAAVACHA